MGVKSFLLVLLVSIGSTKRRQKFDVQPHIKQDENNKILNDSIKMAQKYAKSDIPNKQNRLEKQKARKMDELVETEKSDINIEDSRNFQPDFESKKDKGNNEKLSNNIMGKKSKKNRDELWTTDLKTDEKDLKKKMKNGAKNDLLEIFDGVMRGNKIVGTGNQNVTCAIARRFDHHIRNFFNDPMLTRTADSDDYLTCEFMTRSQSERKTCLITQTLLCDGVSVCASDECECGDSSEVFYCSDGSGCIALAQVCDGQADCLDASDECVCDSYLNCEKERNHAFCKQADRRSLNCGLDSYQKSKIREPNKILSGLFQCLSGELAAYKGHFRNSKMLEEVCKRECKQLSNHCESVDWNSFSVDYTTGDVSMNYTCGADSSIALSSEVDVCDGFYDCPNRAEEAACENRFYCDGGMKSIALSKVCDSVPDCRDLSDECQQCARNNLADDKLMISNKYISYYMVLLCVFVITFNFRGLYGHGAKLYYEKQRFASKLNSMLCIQLCVYDLFMGIYILIVTSKNFEYYGSYCLHDAQWRSSVTCNVTGVIFSFSSHGSLITALIMGLYRCYTCEHILAYFSPKKCVACLAVANILILLSSVVTLLPIQYFEDVFVTAVSFEGNPIVTKGTRTIIDELIMEYYGRELDPSTFSWSDRLALLSNVTSNPAVFEPTGKFGFFNQSPLCIQNLFSEDQGIKLFKLLYVTILGVIILLFSVSYIWIVVTRFQSSVPSADKTQKATKEKNNIKMSKKVALIISSQLLAWIPIIIATILSYCDKNVPQDFYEIAAIILIPVNSLLNPLFHSPKRAFRRITKNSSLTTQQSQVSTPPFPSQQSRLNMPGPGIKTEPKELTSRDLDPTSDEKEVITLSNILVGIDVK